MQMKTAKYKLRVQSAANNPSAHSASASRFLRGVNTHRLSLSGLRLVLILGGHSCSLNFLCVILPPHNQSALCQAQVASSSLCLSFQFPALSHPSVPPVALPAGSWPQHRWALCPGGSPWPAITACTSLVAAATGLGPGCFLLLSGEKWK